MSYLCFLFIIQTEADKKWKYSFTSEMITGQTNMSNRHKERLIEWGYKRKLFNTKNWKEQGIELTEKGQKYVKSHATDEDWNDALKMMYAMSPEYNPEIKELFE